MATSNSILLPIDLRQVLGGSAVTLQGQSTSFTLANGAQSSNRPTSGIPTNEAYLLFSVRMNHNSSAGVVKGGFRIADQDDVAYAWLPMNTGEAGFSTIPDGEDIGWTGLFVLPVGWKIVAATNSSGSPSGTLNWQYCAVRLS